MLLIDQFLRVSGAMQFGKKHSGFLFVTLLFLGMLAIYGCGSLKSENQKLKEKIIDLNAENERLRKDLNALKTENSGMHARFTQLNQQISALQQEIQTMQQDLNVIKTQVQRGKKSKKS